MRASNKTMGRWGSPALNGPNHDEIPVVAKLPLDDSQHGTDVRVVKIADRGITGVDRNDDAYDMKAPSIFLN